MIRILILLVVFIISTQGLRANAAPTIDSISLRIDHQDFLGALSDFHSLFLKSTIKPNQLGYEDFIGYINLLQFSDYSATAQKALADYVDAHPEYARGASIRSRVSRFTGEDCRALTTHILSDRFEYVYCLNAQGQEVSQSGIKQLIRRIDRTRSLRDLSDGITFVAIQGHRGQLDATLVNKYQRRWARRILALDPHWINGYVTLLFLAKDCAEWNAVYENMLANYRGDSSRLSELTSKYGWDATAQSCMSQ